MPKYKVDYKTVDNAGQMQSFSTSTKLFTVSYNTHETFRYLTNLSTFCYKILISKLCADNNAGGAFSKNNAKYSDITLNNE